MGLLGNLFGPKIDKLKERGDVDGLEAIVASNGKLEQRVDAIAALVELEGGAIAESLVAVLGDPDPAVDDTAEKALRSLGTAAAGALAGALGRDDGERVLDLLLVLGDGAAEALQGAAQDGDEPCRLRAISGLLEIAQRDVSEGARDGCVRTLVAALGDRSPTCRMAAANGLEVLHDPSAAKALAAQLKDGDEGVRTACRSTLATIGSPAVPYLVDALADRNPNSKLLAAELLSEIDTAPAEVQDRKAALVTLIDLLDTKDRSLGQAAAAAVRRIPAADVIDMQIERLEDPNSDEREETEALVRRILEHGDVEPRVRSEAEGRMAQIHAMESGEE